MSMKTLWVMQLPSDVVRDGFGLELRGDPYRVAAGVFRCDADHSDCSLPTSLLVSHCRVPI